MADDALSALRNLLFPTEVATQKVRVFVPPRVRRDMCHACPFGPNLGPDQQRQADALKERLSNEPDTIWGCHETVRDGNGGKPQICAGFHAWKGDDE